MLLIPVRIYLRQEISLNLITKIFASKAKDERFQGNSNVKEQRLQQQNESLIFIDRLKRRKS